MDDTVLAYAQWLSELQAHANEAKQHRGELEALREALGLHTAELRDFKRQCIVAIQEIRQEAVAPSVLV